MAAASWAVAARHRAAVLPPAVGAALVAAAHPAVGNKDNTMNTLTRWLRHLWLDAKAAERAITKPGLM